MFFFFHIWKQSHAEAINKNIQLTLHFKILHEMQTTHRQSKDLQISSKAKKSFELSL